MTTTVALAHRLPHPRRDTLRLSPGRVEVLVYHDLEAEEGRVLADRLQHPGVGPSIDLPPSEARLLSSRFGRTIVLTVAGTPVALEATAASLAMVRDDPRQRVGEGDEGMGPIGSGSRMEVTLVLEGRLPQARESTITFADRIEGDDHRVPVKLVLSGLELVRSRIGRRDTGSGTSGELLVGPGEPLELTVRGSPDR